MPSNAIAEAAGGMVAAERISVIPLHESNAIMSIWVTVDGRLTDLRAEHPENTILPIYFTPSGRLIDSRALHP